MIHSKTRTAATLTEVLVAIFVMAIGLLALLTLFPLGALSMAQAIKDDRTAHSAKNANAIAIALVQGDLYLVDNRNLLGTWSPANPSGVFPGVAGPPAIPANTPNYFLNPYPSIPQLPTDPWLAPDLTTGSTDASYPVYVDPRGFKNFGTITGAVAIAGSPAAGLLPQFSVVGGVYPPGVAAPAGAPAGYSSIPRVPLSAYATAPNPVQWLDRWSTLTDDITFSAGKSPTEPADAGTPSLSSLNVQREDRYSWAWLMRQPNGSTAPQVESVVVYSGRSVTSLGEYPYGGVIFGAFWDTSGAAPAVVNTTNFIDVPYQPGARPPVRTGTWILDATMCYWNPFPPPLGTNVPKPHGYFYRVVGVTELGALPPSATVPIGPYKPGSLGLRLEIQGSFKNTDDPTYIPGSYAQGVSPPVPYGVLIVMENVAEVF